MKSLLIKRAIGCFRALRCWLRNSGGRVSSEPECKVFMPCHDWAPHVVVQCEGPCYTHSACVMCENTAECVHLLSADCARVLSQWVFVSAHTVHTFDCSLLLVLSFTVQDSRSEWNLGRADDVVVAETTPAGMSHLARTMKHLLKEPVWIVFLRWLSHLESAGWCCFPGSCIKSEGRSRINKSRGQSDSRSAGNHLWAEDCSGSMILHCKTQVSFCWVFCHCKFVTTGKGWD